MAIENAGDFVHIGLIHFTTRAADAPRQPLRDDTFYRRRDEIRFNLHINEPRDGTRGIVRVKRAEDEVSCQRSMNRHLRRFIIANFAD